MLAAGVDCSLRIQIFFGVNVLWVSVTGGWYGGGKGGSWCNRTASPTMGARGSPVGATHGDAGSAGSS